MSVRRSRLVMALALALSGPGVLPVTAAPSAQVQQMEQLVRFLSQRIQEEEPGASPEAIRGALYESLEMMGVSVPDSIRERGDMSASELANLLVSPTPTSGPAPAVGPTGTRRPADDVFMVEETESAPSPLPPARTAPPPSAPRPVSPAPAVSAAELDALVAAFPQISAFVPPRQAPASPAVAEMARVLLAQPSQNPWKPSLKPVGPARPPAPAPGPARVERPAPPSASEAPAGLGSAPAPASPDGDLAGVDGSARIAEILRHMRSKRRGTRLESAPGAATAPRQDG